MARPPSITDEQIVDAAREVFLEHGLSATTAQVAERAGISEALVFHRFKRKEDLFQRAMAAAPDPPWIAKLPARVGQGEVSEQIIEIAQEGLQFFRRILPLSMLGWSHRPDGSPEHPAPKGVDSPPMRGLKMLSRYFEAEMRLGRLARHDPEIVARTLSGALWEYASMELMFEDHTTLPLPEATFVRGVVQLLMQGLAVEERGAKKVTAKKGKTS